MENTESSPIASPKAFLQQNFISNNSIHKIENIGSSPFESPMPFQMEIDSVHSGLHEKKSIPNTLIGSSNPLSDVPNTFFFINQGHAT